MKRKIKIKVKKKMSGNTLKIKIAPQNTQNNNNAVKPVSVMSEVPIVRQNTNISSSSISTTPSTSSIPSFVSSPPAAQQPVNTLKLKIGNLSVKKEGETQKINASAPTIKEKGVVGADNYQRYREQKDHIYNVPDTYVGLDAQMEREERVFNLETNKFENMNVSLPEAVIKVFMEIYSNAGDNSARSLRQGIDPGEVNITVTDTTITVRNGGIPIPVVKATPPDDMLWVPEMIFGILMTSSNYNKEKVRMECGRNGFGAKLTNIFSKYFKITVADPHNEKLYSQIWTENMSKKEPPRIVPYHKEDKAFVEVQYVLDFQRFKYLDNKYPAETIPLFARHAADLSFALKIPVTFNGKKFNISTAKEYAKLYLGKENVKSSILYYDWPEGTEVVLKKNVEFSKEKGILPCMEICAVDTPDEAIRVSFANGLYMKNGGVHLEAAFKAVASGVLDTVNGNDKDKGNSKGKSKKGGSNNGSGNKKESKLPKLTLNDVKKHISIFVNCWVEDPKFDSQSKLELKAPTPKIVIDEKILRPILKWELVNRLFAELEAKNFKAAAKSDGKKKRFLTGMEKLSDANKAGTNESSECILFLSEGDSAKTFVMKLCSYIPGGKARDVMGVYPLKGKPLNVMNAPPIQVNDNKEIKDLKQILGLKEGVNYLEQENYETLRYGHLVIASDADEDSLHIRGLIMNLFHCKYPSLLARGYVKYLRTKILEAQKGKTKVKFYTQNDYEEWKKVTPDHETWEINYFKGLATSNDEDIKEESVNPKIVSTVYDQYAPMALQLAFSQSLADQRKQWIANWVPDPQVEKMMVQPISSFINHEFIQFSIADIERSIPSFMDGLKVSQRKIMWSALKNWGKQAGPKAKKMKVAQFAAYISQHMGYHHGEKSLEGAIINMAQNFVGSNNLPYFEREGQFGTRSLLGKDAGASRYIFCKPEIYIPMLFKTDDFPILDIQNEEGKDIEPVNLYPILPMQLINGTNGIGTGHSSQTVNHNPLDICYWLECKLKGMTPPNIKPWYRGFKGEIELKVRGKIKVDSEESEDKSGEDNEEDKDEDEVMIDENTKLSMITTGIYEEEGSGKNQKIVIKEIPVGRSIQKYVEYLNHMRENKLLTRYNDYSNAEEPHFELFGYKGPLNEKALKLVKSYGMSNMVYLSLNKKPVKYDTVDNILETFYHLRLSIYQKRKDYLIKALSEKIDALVMKIRFILGVIKGFDLIRSNPKITDEEAIKEGAILVMKKSKDFVKNQLEALNIDPELTKKITTNHYTEEEVELAKQKILECEKERTITLEKKIETFWLEDIKEFTDCYCKHFGCTYESPKKISFKIVTK